MSKYFVTFENIEQPQIHMKSWTLKQSVTHKVQLHFNWYVWINMHINIIYTCCIFVSHAIEFSCKRHL